MESLALLVALMMVVVLILPWNVLLFLKLVNKFKAPNFLKIAMVVVSIFEFIGWLFLYINFLINTNYFVGIAISISWFAYFSAFKEIRKILKEFR